MSSRIKVVTLMVACMALLVACGGHGTTTAAGSHRVQPSTTTTTGPDLSGAALRSLAKPWCDKLRAIAQNQSGDMGLASKTIDLFRSGPTSYVRADAGQI